MKTINLKVTETDVIVSSVSGKIPSGNVESVQCLFDLSSEYDGLLIRAEFDGVPVTVVNGVCFAPPLKPGMCKIAVYGYDMDADSKEYKIIISPTPTSQFVYIGSYLGDYTPNELEAYYKLFSELIEKEQIKGEKGDKGDTGAIGPKGDKGDKGDKGLDGKNGVDGKNGINGTNGLDGIGITNATINLNGELVLSFSDGNDVNLGNVKGAKGEQGTKGDKGDPGRQGSQGVKGDTGESGLLVLSGTSPLKITTLGNHLYYTTTNIKLKTLSTSAMYLELPQGTFLLVEKEVGSYGEINLLRITIWGSCTFDNNEYKYGIHQYRYNTIGGFIENSSVLDTKSIETAIANLEANKQNKLTVGAGITITDNGVISSDVGLKIIVLKDGEDLPNEGTPQENTIYFKRNTETDDESTDWYEEYIWVNNWWELIGTTKVDLSAKQDKLTQEQLENISAVPNKIDKSQVGNGLKFVDGMLQLDIPVANASTAYGGDAQ